MAPLRLNYKAACISVITAGTFRTNHLFASLPSQSGLGWGEIGKAALALQTSPVKITKPPQLKELATALEKTARKGAAIEREPILTGNI